MFSLVPPLKDQNRKVNHFEISILKRVKGILHIEHPFPEPEDETPQCSGIICLAQNERQHSEKLSIGFKVYKVSFGKTNENEGKRFTTKRQTFIIAY